MRRVSDRWRQRLDAAWVVTWIAVVLWVAAVLVLDSQASPDTVVFISAGAFVTLAIPATAASIGLFLLRRRRRR